MIRPQSSDVTQRIIWWCLALATGLVLGVVLLLMQSRPAAADGLGLPDLGGATKPVTDVVEPVTDTVTNATKPVVDTAPNTSASPAAAPAPKPAATTPATD